MDQECRHPTLGEERDPQVPHGRGEIALGKNIFALKLQAVMKVKDTGVHVDEKGPGIAQFVLYDTVS